MDSYHIFLLKIKKKDFPNQEVKKNNENI